MRSMVIAPFVLMFALGACSAVQTPAGDDQDESWMRYRAPDRYRGREWIAVAASSVDRRGFDSTQVDDSAAFTLEGGYDILATEVVHAGFEIGVVWSRHDVAQVTGTSNNPRMSVTRWNLGGRVSLDVNPLNAVLYVDGGIYVRSEDSADEPGFEQDGRGSYAGAGLDFWYDVNGRMGPFVRYYDFADSDLTEVLVGLSATFSL